MIKKDKKNLKIGYSLIQLPICIEFEYDQNNDLEKFKYEKKVSCMIMAQLNANS